jgi:hypothetical protein
LKRNAGKLFVRSFIKSFIIIASLIIIGAVSYRVVMHFLSIPAAETLTDSQGGEAEKITEPSIDEISKNLIYCVDDKTGEISKILLEIFHCKNKKIYYITIPVRTSFTMSDTLYRRLVPVNPTIPQLLKLSGMTRYFTGDTVYEYGVLLIEDLLKIKISYYTVIPQSVYDTMFKTEVTGSYPKEIFTDEYIRFLKTLKTPEDITKYIEEFYSSVQSNLSLAGKKNYTESYSKTQLSGISFELICGTNQNRAYVVDDELAARQIAACTADAAE